MTAAGPLRRCGRAIRRFARVAAAPVDRLDAALGLPSAERERGAATVEFVLLLPAFLMVFLSSFDASILLIRQVMLERAVDIVVRDVRLEKGKTQTQLQLTSQICERARILPHCRQNLLVEMTEIAAPLYAMPENDAPCVNQLTSIVPPTNLVSQRTGKVILLRACFSAEPVLPLAVLTVNRTLASNLVNNEDGTVRMVTSTAFMVEQNQPNVP